MEPLPTAQTHGNTHQQALPANCQYHTPLSKHLPKSLEEFIPCLIRQLPNSLNFLAWQNTKIIPGGYHFWNPLGFQIHPLLLGHWAAWEQFSVLLRTSACVAIATTEAIPADWAASPPAGGCLQAAGNRPTPSSSTQWDAQGLRGMAASVVA